MKKLGFGLMRLPVRTGGKASDVDVEQVKAMVDEFMAHGFTYFDTAIRVPGGYGPGVPGTAGTDRRRLL